VIVLDTSILIDALCGQRRSEAALRRALEDGERMLVPSLVLYEWLRGPRRTAELDAQEALFPAATALQFGAVEAARAAQLFLALPKAKSRHMDLAIAATAMVAEADLWTLNARDFGDIPGLTLYSPR
jgi:predicted nucleic acid-binding protein